MNYQSKIFSQYLSDEEMTVAVGDEAFINKMLQFEIALAKSQASLNIIPKLPANEIGKTLSEIKISPAELAEGTLQNGVPVVTLLSIAKNKLSGEAQKYLHYGVTSQDVMDTAQVLIFRDVLAMIEKKADQLHNALKELFNKHKGVQCMARTRGQQAMPITFDVKVDAWMQPVERQMQRLREIKRRLLVVQLGGAAGTLSVFGDKGRQLVEVLANELDLQTSSPWHSQRDNICEFTNWLAILTGVLGKMGSDILVMSQSEIGEVIENPGGGKSSVMPHKNNPVLSEALVAMARMNATLQMQLLESIIHVNERDGSAWILEWNAVPQMLLNTGTALNHAVTIATKMKVLTDHMRRNVEIFFGNKET